MAALLESIVMLVRAGEFSFADCPAPPSHPGAEVIWDVIVITFHGADGLATDRASIGSDASTLNVEVIP